MNENIKKLLDKVSGDEALLAKFSACKSIDEAYDLACTLVDGYSKEEFVKVMTTLNAIEDGDISDEDLAAAAGGDVGDFVDNYASYLSIIGESVKSSVWASKSIVKSAKVVSEEASKSIVKSAKEVSKLTEDAAKSVAKSVTKVSKALAV